MMQKLQVNYMDLVEISAVSLPKGSLVRVQIDLATAVFGGEQDITVDTATACATWLSDIQPPRPHRESADDLHAISAMKRCHFLSDPRTALPPHDECCAST